MSLFQFPFVRLSYPSLGNPAYVDDIVAANQLTLDGFANLTNGGILGTYGGFCILGGFSFNPSTGTYGGGIVYFNGNIYVVNSALSQGQYLTPTPVSTLPRPFSDTNTRPIYQLNQASPTNDPTGGGNGATPAFNGNMNQYRFDLYTLATGLQAAQAKLGTLGAAAYANIGTAPGTVAAGNDSRFGYSIAAANALFATQALVLLRGNPGGNNTGFIPTDPYDPMTLTYAQSNFIQILAKGYTVLGNADPAGGTTVNIGIGTTLSTNQYKVLFSIVSLSGNPSDDTYWAPTVVASLQTTSQFSLRFREGSGSAQDIAVDWVVIPR